MTSWRDHVRLLAIFHYVLGGLTLLFSLLPALYIAMGLAMVGGAFGRDRSGDPPPEVFGWFFAAIGGALLLFVLGFAALLFVTGRFLQRERHWTFCIVIAALACAFFPFGTVLGVFTILVLSKDEVRAAFAAPTALSATPQPPP